MLRHWPGGAQNWGIAMADMDKADPITHGREDPADLAHVDELFATARAARPALPAHLAAAILDDAAAQQPDGTAAALAPRNAREGLGRWRQLLKAVGGWPAFGGFVMASAAGLWLGLSPPSFIPDPVVLAGLDADSQGMPFDGYEMAMVLSEDMQ